MIPAPHGEAGVAAQAGAEPAQLICSEFRFQAAAGASFSERIFLRNGTWIGQGSRSLKLAPAAA